jgi:hypothetical protein
MARDRERAADSPWSALIFAALFSAILLVAWAIGMLGKYSQRPPNPKSWSEIMNTGPLYFACSLAGLFVLLYGYQRLSGRRLEEPQTRAFICPKCHTPQHQHERQCTCPVELEPLEKWKWV